jgi:hypothetical protein
LRYDTKNIPYHAFILLRFFFQPEEKEKPADLLAEYHNYKVGSLNKNFKPIPLLKE